eukprot:gene1666-3220_t
MKCFTPQVLWHGGANENGKTDPVFSLDMHPSNNTLVTSGIDANTPPKGAVRLWKVDHLLRSNESGMPEWYMELSDHCSVINVARFSPCGRYLATASDRQITLFILVISPETWSTITDIKMVERNMLRSSLEEIYDLQWSSDSHYVVAGAIDSKAEIIKVHTRASIQLLGHSKYVQGVAWDPLDQMVVTQSADRTCRVHQFKYKTGTPLKLGAKATLTIKMLGSGSSPSVGTEGPVTASSVDNPPVIGTKSPPSNLYADDTVPCFFRRLAFSPDGSLLITPSGVLRSTVSENVAMTTSATTTAQPAASFCTHIFSREHMNQPLLSLSGLEEPSVAVRFSPVLYRMIPSTCQDSRDLFPGKYRFVFAVATLSAVLIYDTQHFAPLARITGCHLATINDVAWSSDGHMLSFCSSDGYVSFVRFEEGSLGEALPLSEHPEIMQKRKTGPTDTTPSDDDVTTGILDPVVISTSPLLPIETLPSIQMTAVPLTSSDLAGNEQRKKRRITPVLVPNGIVPVVSESVSAMPLKLPLTASNACSVPVVSMSIDQPHPPSTTQGAVPGSVLHHPRNEVICIDLINNENETRSLPKDINKTECTPFSSAVATPIENIRTDDRKKRRITPVLIRELNSTPNDTKQCSSVP